MTGPTERNANWDFVKEDAGVLSSWELDKDCWLKALEKSRCGEEAERLKSSASKAAPSQPAWYALNDRPVQLVPTPEGGLDCLALDMRTGEFVRDLSCLSRCLCSQGDVDAFADQASFDAYVSDIRQRMTPRTT